MKVTDFGTSRKQLSIRHQEQLWACLVHFQSWIYCPLHILGGIGYGSCTLVYDIQEYNYHILFHPKYGEVSLEPGY